MDQIKAQLQKYEITLTSYKKILENLKKTHDSELKKTNTLQASIVLWEKIIGTLFCGAKSITRDIYASCLSNIRN
jgi:hypothetical protein